MSGWAVSVVSNVVLVAVFAAAAAVLMLGIVGVH